jgi:hypothetical protein
MSLKDIKKQFEREHNGEPKTPFDKLVEYLEIEKASSKYRNRFFELLNDFVEETLREELEFQKEVNK